MGGGAGGGGGEAAEAGDIARQFDDPLVVDVIQHENRCPGRRSERSWRLGFIVLYMDRNGGKTARPFAEGGRTCKPARPRAFYGWDSGVRRQYRPVCPVTLRSFGPVERR